MLYERPPTPEKPSGIASLASRFRTAGALAAQNAREAAAREEEERSRR